MKKESPSDEDLKYFHDAVKDVKPLKKYDKVGARHAAPVRIRPVVSHAAPNQVEDFLSDHITATVHADEELFFAHPGLQHKVIRDFRQGKITPAMSLDLHKMTVEQARKAVTQFLAEGAEQNLRCVHIIHGKGKLNADAPILKNQINNWLRRHPAVLAFCSAAKRDGGVGAVYVLLRRQRLEF